MSDDDYYCYMNLEQEVRTVIDKSYVISGTQWYSRCAGIVCSGWHMVRKPVIWGVSFITLITTIALFEHKYPLLFKTIFNEDNKKILELVCQVIKLFFG